jgi:tripartite-type tricarboxylate transporter receptor subunit TctC
MSRIAVLLSSLAVSWFAALVSLPAFAGAADFPIRSVRLIVPFEAGGGTDIVARALAQKLTDAWKQNVVVDNRPGGGSTIGTAVAARSEPDGHTLLISTATYSVNPSLYKKLPFDPVKDLTPVSQVTSSLSVITVHPSTPATSMQQLVAYARTNPGKVTYATAGNGSSGHLGTELLKNMAGVDMTHVPFKGSGPAMIAVVGGQVTMMMGSTTTAIPHIRAGRLRALGVTTTKRFAGLPDVPTVAESGFPGYEMDGWYGVFAPSGIPRARLEAISRDIATGMQSPDLKERLARDGVEAVGTTPEVFGKYVAAEMAKWAKVIKESKLQVD